MKRLFMAALLLGAVSAWAESPSALLVAPFHNASGDRELDAFAAGVADLLTACFTAYPEHVGVVDRTELDAVSAEQALGWQGYLASKPTNELGGLAKARYLLRGSVTAQAGGLHVEALLFDIQTTHLLYAASAQGEAGELMEGLCERVAASVAGFLAKGAAGSSEPKLAVEAQPERQQLLIRGLSHYYHGDYARALPAFLDLVDRHPEDASGHFWLGRSLLDAGLPALARVQFQSFLRRFPGDPKHERAKAMLESLEADEAPLVPRPLATVN